MAIVLKPKRSATAAKVPTTTDLASGELGVNMADRKVYINNGTSVVQVGAGLLSALGDVNMTGIATGNTISWNGSQFVPSAGGSGTVTSVGVSVPTGLSVSGSPVTSSGTIAISLAAGYSIPTTASQATWDTASTERRQWDGGSTNLVAATGRTSLGATTLGSNLFTLANVAAISFPRINADNTVSALDAATFRSAIGAGTSSTTGTVTSVALSLPAIFSVSGSPVTSSGTLTAALASQTANTFFAAPNGAAGAPTFRAIVAADVPTLNQNTTGSAATLTTGRTIAMTGDVSWTSASFNGSANVTGTATLANSGVTAGTYTKITVDAKGRATAGTTLAASDIPDLSLEKIPDAWVKRSVRVATTANITLSGTQTIDGVAVVAGDRVLVKDQTAAAENGIYVASATAWARAADADTISELAGACVNVDSGTANGGFRFDTDLKTTDTLGTTAANFYRVLDSLDLATANTANKVVQRDASGNFSAGTITAALSGNATTATTLQTGRTIALTGDVTYTSGSFNGSANVTGTATLANSGVTAGTYTKVTVDAKGRVTAGASLASADLPTYTGTITSSQVTTGLGYTPLNPGTSQTANFVYAAPNGTAGAPAFRALVAADIPTLNQNTTGTAANVTGTVAIANGGTGATTAAGALTNLGAYAASNPSGYTSNTGTVTSITAGTGLSGGTITTSGTIALANTTVTAGSYTNASITVDAQGRITSASSGSGGGVTSFNTRTGAVTLTTSDVTTALGYTPLSTGGGTLTGNLGLGSGVTPASLIHLGTNNPEIRWDDDDAAGVVQLRHTANSFLLTIDPTNVDASSNFIVRIDNSDRFTLTGSTATVTTSGSSDSLTINDTGANGANIRLIGNGATTPNKTIRAQNGAFQILNSAYSAPILTLTDVGDMTTPGNHVINNASPTLYFQDTDNNSAMLHCNSNLMYILRGGNNSQTWTQVGGYWPVYWDLTNNNATFGGSIWAAGNITAYSDEKLKANWTGLADDFVAKLAQVKAGAFDRIDTGKRQVGVSAQSLQTVIPEAVEYHEKEDLLSVSYGNAALAAAVELAKRVIQLEARLKELELKAA